MAHNEKEQAIVSYANEKNLFVEPGALKLLKDRDDFKEIIDEIANANEFTVSVENLKNKVLKTKLDSVEKEVVAVKSHFKPKAKDYDSNLKIISEWDVTGQSNCGGSVKDFLNMFQSKFEFLKNELNKRHALAPREISKIKSIPDKEKIDLIGMISKKWVTKNGHTAVELEDLDGKCIVVFSKNDHAMQKASDRIILDDVIGIKATKLSDELVLANEIYLPDLPIREMKTINEDISIVGLTDLHVGSKLHLENAFNKFLAWINCEIASEKEREAAGKVKYIVMTGDNVDGIGIYPNQYDELSVKSITKQYEQFVEYIKQIPEHIEIVMIPGNHDAVRHADPQPALPKTLVPELYEMKNVHLIGSPGRVEIEGFNVLMYHGGCLHDLHSNVNFLDLSRPHEGMIEILKRRDLMPAYGTRQPYVPEKKNFMLIREVPDFFFMGEMHHNGYGTYRGCSAICSGTFQAKTAFQAKLGHTPTPGIVPVIDLKTRKLTEKYFYKNDLNQVTG
ncbi:MAG: DNA-directed DNA polymerase II small subunit [Candidatus Diapherotrites archaeon]